MVLRICGAARPLTFLIGVLVLLLAQASVVLSQGRLVIAGGGLEDDNQAVFEAFLSSVDRASGRVAIIPGASVEPSQAAALLSKIFEPLGINAAQIDIVRLALVDDPSTEEVDESRWDRNARDMEEIEKIQQASAIWIAGGDQLRLTRLLIDEADADTPMLAALRTRLTEGATVGGTGAGAAVVSRLMIAGGDNMASLLEDIATADMNAEQQQGQGLIVALGFGFFPGVVVDQHFDRWVRLGRLSRAVMLLDPMERVGFGIDENTALVVDLAANSASVVGSATVTVIDGREATVMEGQARFAGDGMALSVLSSGDSIDLETFKVTPADFKSRTIGNELYDTQPLNGGGMAVPRLSLSDMLGTELINNSASSSIERTSFLADGRAVRYEFTQGPLTDGFWGRDDDGGERYTVTGVDFAIAPVDVRFLEPIE